MCVEADVVLCWSRYALSVVARVRTWIAPSTLVRMALGSTLAAIAPGAMISLSTTSAPLSDAPATAAAEARALLLALSSSAWAFFLFSYQVHEKSVLLPLAPLPFLADSIAFGSSPPRADSTQHLFVAWLGALGAFSIWPLLVRDGLGLAYVACLALHALASVLCAEASPQGERPTPVIVSFVFAAVTVVGAVALHVAWLLVPPPSRLPDLYPSLIALYCGKSQRQHWRRRGPSLTSVAYCRCAVRPRVPPDHPRAVAGDAVLASPLEYDGRVERSMIRSIRRLVEECTRRWNSNDHFRLGSRGLSATHQ